jgi:UDP-2,4-diacetamido-2,4,6-trideoxy-beta-L-altropyranose hydrolase
MHIAIRVDASVDMGSGHVMRCLSLATALRQHGSTCVFICREHPGNLMTHIRSCGFEVLSLGQARHASQLLASDGYADWLGASTEQDSRETVEALRHIALDWLIVDHYAIDSRWERVFYERNVKIWVIDDLANRSHICHALLDQTYQRETEEYRQWVPSATRILCGSKYTLLRPEFGKLRDQLGAPKQSKSVERILISMGSVDKLNLTARVLDKIKLCHLDPHPHFSAVLGSNALWIDAIKEKISTMTYKADLYIDTDQMAQLMARSDLAIGAAGSTSWERCCLGLPAIQFVTAANQIFAAAQLHQAGAVVSLGEASLTDGQFEATVLDLSCSPHKLAAMSLAAWNTSDASGVASVASAMYEQSGT